MSVFKCVSDALWSGYGHSLKKKKPQVCSLGLCGTATAFGSAQKERNLANEKSGKRGHFNLNLAGVHFDYLHATHHRWMLKIFLFICYLTHTSPTMPPPPSLLSCTPPSVSLLSLLLYSSLPTIPSSPLSLLTVSFPLIFFPVVEGMPGLWHSHHLRPHPSPSLSLPLPPPRLHFISPLPFFSLSVFLLLFAVSLNAGVWNVKSPLLKVLGWAVSWGIPEQQILFRSE